MEPKLVSGVAVVAADPSFTVLEADDAFFELLDGTREASRPPGLRAPEFRNPEAVERIRAALAGCPDRASLEVFVRRKEGSSGQVYVSAVRLPGRLHENRYPVYHMVVLDVADLPRGPGSLPVARAIPGQPAGLEVTEQETDVSFEYDFASDRMRYGDTYRMFFNGPAELSPFREAVPDGNPSPDDVNEFFRALIADIVAGCETGVPEFRFAAARGLRWFSVFRTVLRDDEGAPVKLVGLLRDIEGRKAQELLLFNQSRSDAMTGLRNKTAAEEEIRAALRDMPPGVLCALLMIDVDDFKTVNDTLGHLAGDEVILRIARQLLDTFRRNDIVGRVGGDEFHVCIRDVSSPEIACEKARQLCESIPGLFAGEELGDGVSVSIGIACAERGASYEQLFREADIALYQAKSNGKNRYQLFGRARSGSGSRTSPGEERRAAGSRRSLLGEVVSALFGAEEMGEGLEKALTFIGHALDLDRIVFFEAFPDDGPGRVLWQWLAEGSARSGGADFPGDRAELPSWMKKGELFYCGDTAGLDPEKRALLNDASLTALLRCDIAEPSGTVGHISFEQRGRTRIWSQQETDLLVLLARLAGEYLRRRRSARLLRKNAESTRDIFDCLPLTAVYVVSREDRTLLYCNETVRRLVPGVETGLHCGAAFRLDPGYCADCPLSGAEPDHPVHTIRTNTPFGPVMDMTVAPLVWENGERACVVLMSEHMRSEEEKALEKRREAFSRAVCASYEYVADIDPESGRLEYFAGGANLDHRLPGNYEQALEIVCGHFVAPAYRERYRAAFSLESMRKAFDKGAAQIRMEYESLRGGLRWMERFAVPYQLDDGTRRIVAYSRDISERKAAEDAAGNLETRFQAVFRKSWDLVGEVNLQTWAYTQTIFGKKNLFSLVRDDDYRSVFRFVSEELIHFRDLPDLRAALSPEALYRARRDEADVHCRYRLSDGRGSNLWMESRVVFIEEKGIPKAFLLTRDISGLKHAEEVQQQRERSFSLALRSTYAQIYELDAEQATSRLLYRNDNGLLAEVPDGPIRFSAAIESRIHPDDRGVFRKTYAPEALKRRLGDGTGKLAVEYRHLARDGKYRWVSAELLAMRQLDGPGRVLALIRDVQDRKEQDRRRDRYDRALCAIYDEVYELSVTRDRYRIVHHLKDKYVTPPEEGVLSENLMLVADHMLYPEDRGRFLDFFDLEAIRNDFKGGAEYRQGEFRKLWISGDYRWTSLTVFPLALDPGGEELYLVFVMDIDARKRAEETARQNVLLERRRLDDRRYKVIVDQTGTLVFEWALDGVTRYLSPEIPHRFCGTYDQRDVLRVWLEDGVIHAGDKAGLKALLRRIAAGGEHAEMTGRLYCRDGKDIWCRIACTRLRDAEGRPDRFIGTLNDVDAEVRSVKALKYRAEYDPLTGIYNMHAFYAHTERLLREHPDRRYSLIRMDIDRFKVINDLYGLEEGNRLLRALGSLLGEKARGHGVWGRIGGDIFCACVDWPVDSIPAVLRDISAALARYPLAHRIAAYFGICRVDSVDTPVNILCDWANLALRTVKGSCLTTYAFYDGTLREAILAEKKIENDMQGALSRGEFIMYLQPKVDLRTSRVVGAEGLARWRTPGGLIPPVRFVPLFEKNGFILRLDEHIWELACIALRRWRDRGWAPVPISVNVSRLHIHDTRFCEKLIGLVRRYDVPPALLELELTESAFLENESALPAAMNTLREHGFTFSLDDFGAGYSSLNMLKNMAIDTIKIDRGFLAAGGASEQGRTVVRHAIAMARDLNLKVVAEGVEHEEQANFLLRSGCSCAQGYYYAPPLPLDRFEVLAFDSIPVLPNISVTQPNPEAPPPGGDRNS